MKLVIDITEQAYNLLNSDEQIDWLGAETLLECIARGTPYEEQSKGKCIDCPYKTDTCQEGLHCPRD